MTISDIVNKVYFLTRTNSSSFLAADMLIAINNAYERVASLILSIDGRWQFDDNNYTDYPVATTALVTDQQDYVFATSHLDILSVEIKDMAGNWSTIKPIDQVDMDYRPSTTDFLKTSGTPIYYDKIANSLLLYPKPSYSQSASLKVRFQRGPDLYTSTEVSDGIKEPGFNSLYHDLIPLWVSYEYWYLNDRGLADRIMLEINRKEESMKNHYSKRNKDEPSRLKPLIENNK